MRTSDTAARIVPLDSETVEDVLQRAQELIAGYDQELRRELPEGAEIFDAHVHLGNDIDGFSGVYEDLEQINDRYGISRAFVFCMDEPDRHPSFRAANDRTLVAEDGLHPSGKMYAEWAKAALSIAKSALSH
jgi:lysophospholipase L1-like esterase